MGEKWLRGRGKRGRGARGWGWEGVRWVMLDYVRLWPVLQINAPFRLTVKAAAGLFALATWQEGLLAVGSWPERLLAREQKLGLRIWLKGIP